MMLTGFFAAIFACFHVVLTMRVGFHRISEKISSGDGGHDVLARKIRVHGNFVETVPMALFLMLIAELSGAPHWSLYGLACTLFVGRVVHAIALTKGDTRLRAIGMALSVSVIVLGALLCFWLALPVVLSA